MNEAIVSKLALGNFFLDLPVTLDPLRSSLLPLAFAVTVNISE